MIIKIFHPIHHHGDYTIQKEQPEIKEDLWLKKRFSRFFHLTETRGTLPNGTLGVETSEEKTSPVMTSKGIKKVLRGEGNPFKEFFTPGGSHRKEESLFGFHRFLEKVTSGPQHLGTINKSLKMGRKSVEENRSADHHLIGFKENPIHRFHLIMQHTVSHPFTETAPPAETQVHLHRNKLHTWVTLVSLCKKGIK
jgi:hypothetical protein